MSQKVLVVEDDINIAELLRLYLEKDGFEVKIAHDGGEGLKLAESEQPDLVLLDIMLPVLDGWQVCRRLRKTTKTPIIMLTAKGETEDKVSGLEMGADDYIVKPFSPREVISRIKAVLRRASNAGETDKQEALTTLTYGNLEIQPERYSVKLNGEPISCTPREVELLHLLASHPGRVFEREQILSRIWGYDFFGDTRTVDTHIKRLRQKLSCPQPCGWEIVTVYGVGYKFEVTA